MTLNNFLTQLSLLLNFMETNRNLNQINDRTHEISLNEIINFFKDFWQIIAGFMALGIAGAVLFILVVPKQYEARVQIKMAQIVYFNPNDTTTAMNPSTINVEDPASLISRMSYPTFYSNHTISECALADNSNPYEAITGKIKLSIPRGVTNVVEIKVRDASKDIAKTCLEAIVQLIHATQSSTIEPYVKEAKERLSNDIERLKKASELIAKSDKSGEVISATYLSTRDLIMHLLDQIAISQNLISSQESRGTKTTVPVYSSNKPIFPVNIACLLIGLVLGGILGLIFAIAQKSYLSKTKDICA